MSLLMTVATALTQDPPVDVDPGTGKGPEWGKAAPIGLLVILLMVIATFFLLRSMVRKINKVPASFDPPVEPDNADPSAVDRTAVDRPAVDRAAGDPGVVVPTAAEAVVPASVTRAVPDADPGSAERGDQRPG